MKNLKRKTSWYLFVDGENLSVTTHPEQYSAKVGVLIPISANEAATILALMITKKSPPAEEGGEDNA